MPFSPLNSKIKSFCDSQIQLPIVSSETRGRIISLSTLFPACPQESQVSTVEAKARPKECFQSCNKQHGLNSYQNNNICALTRYIHTKKTEFETFCDLTFDEFRNKIIIKGKNLKVSFILYQARWRAGRRGEVS